MTVKLVQVCPHSRKHKASARCYYEHNCECSRCAEVAHRFISRNKKPLSPEKLIELRRMVGVPDEGPAPEPRSKGGRPKKEREDTR